jgi:divalent metal cation (Fe/Co/Zn/Cd) transporter
VLHVHDVRTRGRRDAVYVDLTVHLDEGLSLREAHEAAERIEATLQAAHPEIVDVVVHLEPEGHEIDPGTGVEADPTIASSTAHPGGHGVQGKPSG